MNFTEDVSSPPETGIVWVKPNGTVIATLVSGQNSTGSDAYNIARGLLTYPFFSEYFYFTVPSANFLSNPNVHVINQSNVQLGPTTLAITNYGNNSPITFCGFGNMPETFEKIQVQVGRIPGTTMDLVPLRYIAGSFDSYTFSASNRITSVSKA